MNSLERQYNELHDYHVNKINIYYANDNSILALMNNIEFIDSVIHITIGTEDLYIFSDIQKFSEYKNRNNVQKFGTITIKTKTELHKYNYILTNNVLPSVIPANSCAYLYSSDLTAPEIGCKPINRINYVGLSNNGNTCYMNAGIQFLYSIPELRDFLRNITFGNLVHTNNDVKFLFLMKNLFAQLETSNASLDLSTIFFKNASNIQEKYNELFIAIALNPIQDANMYTQPNDASVFVIKFLESISNIKTISPAIKSVVERFENTIFYKINNVKYCKTTCRPVIVPNSDANLIIIPISHNNSLQQYIYDYSKEYLGYEIPDISGLPEFNQIKTKYDIDIEDRSVGEDWRQLIGKFPIASNIQQFKNCNEQEQYLIQTDQSELVVDQNNNNLLFFINRVDATGYSNRSVHANPKINIKGINYRLICCILFQQHPEHYVFIVFNDNGEPIQNINDSISNFTIPLLNTINENGYLYLYRRCNIINNLVFNNIQLGGYKDKYLKYKQKYLELKNLNI
jgi:hypothetical protein